MGVDGRRRGWRRSLAGQIEGQAGQDSPAVVEPRSIWMAIALEQALPYRRYPRRRPGAGEPANWSSLTDIHHARAQFGGQLRRLRQEAGLTGKQLARRLGWAPSKVSKIETGKQTATTEDVRVWAATVGAANQVVEILLTDLRTVRFEYASWRRQLSGGMAPRQRISGALEASATVIRAIEVDIVPRLLQTPDDPSTCSRGSWRYVGCRTTWTKGCAADCGARSRSTTARSTSGSSLARRPSAPRPARW